MAEGSRFLGGLRMAVAAIACDPFRQAIRLTAALVGAALVLNVAAVWRYPGGPLEPFGGRSGAFGVRLGTGTVIYSDAYPDAQSGWTPAATVAPDEHVFLAGVWLRDDWPVGATVERVEPVWKGPAPSVAAVLVRAADQNAQGLFQVTQATRFVSRGAGGLFAAPPVAVAPRSCCEPDNQILVEMDGSRLGVFHLTGFWLDYRVGPLAFHTFVPDGDAFQLSPSPTAGS